MRRDANPDARYGEDTAKWVQQEAIPPKAFTTVGLALHLASSSVGPDDNHPDFAACPRWNDVEVSAPALRAAFLAEGAPSTSAADKQASAAPASQLPSDPAPPEKRKRGGHTFDYAKHDEPLVQEMRAMISDGRASGAWDAALAVADRAEGGAKLESKAKRLLLRYKKACSEPFSPEPL